MTPAEFRALREAMSLTQPELGDAMGLNTATVRRIETAAVEAVHPRDALAIERLALIAAAFEALCDVLHLCDTEAQAIANRISGPRGERNRCPDGVQVLEDAETIIRAAAALVTPSDATAALARIVREAEARGMVKGMREAATLLREQGYGTAPKQILARAAEIERDGK